MSADEAKLLHTCERHLFQDTLRYNRTRQGAFECAMLHFDHPVFSGGRNLDPSDCGDGAAAIRGRCEGTPRWRELWQVSAAKLPPKGKAVLAALMQDWRTAPAAKIAGVSRPTVDAWKKNFKIHFAQCFWAWERDFGL